VQHKFVDTYIHMYDDSAGHPSKISCK